MITFPEDDSFSHENADLAESLDTLDYSSRLASANLGSVFIAILVSPVIYSFIFFLKLIKSKSLRAEKLHDWLEAKFMWNWLIRLTLEASLELTMTALMALSISLGERESLWIEKADFFFSAFVLLWSIAYVFFIVCYYP